MIQIYENIDCMEGEIFKPVEGYCNKYFISNKGRLYSCWYKKIINGSLSDTGYLFIQLYKNGKYKIKKIHRLVIETFLANSNNKPCINHIDGDKLNNCLENLEYCTYSENLIHAYDTNLNQKRRPVAKYDLDSNLLQIYGSAREAEKDGFSNQNISKCCTGKRKTHKGYIWRFYE